jgi:flagellar biosynthesis/type III secretory pathway protein FliH
VTEACGCAAFPYRHDAHFDDIYVQRQTEAKAEREANATAKHAKEARESQHLAEAHTEGYEDAREELRRALTRLHTARYRRGDNYSKGCNDALNAVAIAMGITLNVLEARTDE